MFLGVLNYKSRQIDGRACRRRLFLEKACILWVWDTDNFPSENCTLPTGIYSVLLKPTFANAKAFSSQVMPAPNSGLLNFLPKIQLGSLKTEQ